VRLLAHRGSLAGHPRLARAVAGLAGRGHEVVWTGGPPAAGAHDPAVSVTRARVDVVIGGGRPFAPALAGWWAGAHGMLLEPGPAARRWSLLDRLAWTSLDAIAVHDAAAASPATAGRSVVWPAAPAGAAADPAHPDVETLERACERLHARRRGFAARPAVFLDRDGTLVVERGYLSDPDQIELLPGVAGALRALSAAGYSLVVVSNQSGVGRGLFSLTRVHEAMARLRRELRVCGVELDAIYFCPHRPEDGCACRKPGGELLRRAAEDLRLSLRDSAMVGDKRLDVETAHRAGIAGVLVRTGYGREEENAGAPGARPPELVADDLAAATAWLVDRRGLAQRGRVSS
jgi:histidinol-phosphate phosphatase family protein